MSVVEYEAGLVARKRIRDFLSEQKFIRGGFDWHETKSFAVSTFLIKGESPIVTALADSIDKWCSEVNK